MLPRGPPDLALIGSRFSGILCMVSNSLQGHLTERIEAIASRHLHSPVTCQLTSLHEGAKDKICFRRPPGIWLRRRNA